MNWLKQLIGPLSSFAKVLRVSDTLEAWQRQRRRHAQRSFRRSRSGLLGMEVLESRIVPAASLSITPISWDIIGLDSNNVNGGPNDFLVGARVKNTGDQTANNVVANFTWD